MPLLGLIKGSKKQKGSKVVDRLLRNNRNLVNIHRGFQTWLLLVVSSKVLRVPWMLEFSSVHGLKVVRALPVP